MGNSLTPHIENASKTGVLQLTMQKLEKPPEEINILKGNLRTLDISKNRLISVHWIVDFKMLKQFTANDNRVAELPENLGSLTKLENLSIARNRLTRLPASLADLRMLKVINLSGNALSRFPVQLCGMRQIDLIDLSGNRISDLPDEVKDLQCLELILNQNRLSSLSDGLAQCPRLKVLRLEENCLPLAAFTRPIMAESQICLLAVEGNVFQIKDFHNIDGYAQYMERYTATKKKAM